MCSILQTSPNMSLMNNQRWRGHYIHTPFQTTLLTLGKEHSWYIFWCTANLLHVKGPDVRPILTTKYCKKKKQYIPVPSHHLYQSLTQILFELRLFVPTGMSSQTSHRWISFDIILTIWSKTKNLVLQLSWGIIS